MIKIYPLIGLLSLIVCASCAQSLVDSTNRWKILQDVPDASWTYEYRFGKDTIIHNNTYKQLIRASVFTNYTDWNFTNDYYRELNGEVYHLYGADTLENEVFDFNLSQGDTFNIEVVDTTYLISLNGFIRKKILFESGLEWLEGVGNLEKGPLVCPPNFYCPQILICYDSADVQLWMNQLIDSCDIIQVGIEENTTNTKLNIYPNPNNSSSFTFNQSADNIEIYSIAGKRVKSYPNTSHRYDIQGFSPGIYIVKGLMNDQNFVEKLYVE